MLFAAALRIRPLYFEKLNGTPLAQCWCCDRLTRRAVCRGDEDSEPFGLCSEACEQKFYEQARDAEWEAITQDALLEQQELEAIDGGAFAEAQDIDGYDY
jgi:hypothetical protein